MYRRAVRLQLPDYIFIIARRVGKLLHSYEYLMNSYEPVFAPARRRHPHGRANICLEFTGIGGIITSNARFEACEISEPKVQGAGTRRDVSRRPRKTREKEGL